MERHSKGSSVKDGVIDKMKGNTSGEDNGTITNPQLVYIRVARWMLRNNSAAFPKRSKF